MSFRHYYHLNSMFPLQNKQADNSALERVQLPYLPCLNFVPLMSLGIFTITAVRKACSEVSVCAKNLGPFEVYYSVQALSSRANVVVLL